MALGVGVLAERSDSEVSDCSRIFVWLQSIVVIFEQYDHDHDGFISMEENLEQDKHIADEQGKPFDEVRDVSRKFDVMAHPAQTTSHLFTCSLLQQPLLLAHSIRVLLGFDCCDHFEQEHSRRSFERADLDKDGRVSLEEMATPKPPEEHCKDLYGQYAEYDGVQSCRCMKSYTADAEGTCIKGTTEVCVKQFGPFAEFDGVNTCICKNGTIPDANGTCIQGSDVACKDQFGPLALFNSTSSTCACSIGSVPDLNSTCVPGSNEQCQEWYGPNTAFDGNNLCVCKKGFVYADGECFRGSNKVLALPPEPTPLLLVYLVHVVSLPCSRV